MLGNKHEAIVADLLYVAYRRAVNDYQGQDWRTRGTRPKPGDFLPKGWTYLGAGISRSAYLGPSGVVYKVEHNPQGVINKGEHEFSVTFWKHRRRKAIREALEVLYIPKTYLWDNRVLAMEYIEPAGRGVGTNYRRTALELGIGDLGEHNNIRMADGRVAIIDLGWANSDSVGRYADSRKRRKAAA